METRASTGGARTWIAVASALVVLAFVGIWMVGQRTTNADVPEFALRIYPGTWSPFWRGVLWLAAGAAAVTFDGLVVGRIAQTRRARAGVLVLAGVTGISFLVFSIASFAGAPWSVIH